MTLAAIRKEWESKLAGVFFRNQHSTHGNALSVLEDKRTPGSYYCHRYFTIGENWEVSVDESGCTAQAVFAWIAENVAN